MPLPSRTSAVRCSSCRRRAEDRRSEDRGRRAAPAGRRSRRRSPRRTRGAPPTRSSRAIRPAAECAVGATARQQEHVAHRARVARGLRDGWNAPRRFHDDAWRDACRLHSSGGKARAESIYGPRDHARSSDRKGRPPRFAGRDRRKWRWLIGHCVRRRNGGSPRPGGPTAGAYPTSTSSSSSMGRRQSRRPKCGGARNPLEDSAGGHPPSACRGAPAGRRCLIAITTEVDRRMLAIAHASSGC